MNNQFTQNGTVSATDDVAVSARELQIVLKIVQQFFNERGFEFVYVGDRLLIRAACEDVRSIAMFEYRKDGDDVTLPWPQKQTSQMDLEDLVLAEGFIRVHTLTTSYRKELRPIRGRHEGIFPLYEFEALGGYGELLALLEEFVQYLGFDAPVFHYYDDVCDSEGEVGWEQEKLLNPTPKSSAIITHFPVKHSFWNMRRTPDGKYAYKADVILGGMETIGSGDREDDLEVMRTAFETLMDGEYASTLRELFGARIDREITAFLSHQFVKRYGGGIGLNRLVRAMRGAGLLPQQIL